jgi:hypothetical protein
MKKSTSISPIAVKPGNRANTDRRMEINSKVRIISSSRTIVLTLILLSSVSFLVRSASAQKPALQPPRIVRSSIVRPTRVSYGDIEKTNKTCLPKDSCAPSRNDRNGAMMNDPKRRNCFCDQQCIVYEDCCVDSPFRRDPNVTYRKNELFQCVTLRQFGSLYMKTKCPVGWRDDMVSGSSIVIILFLILLCHTDLIAYGMTSNVLVRVSYSN